MWLNLVRWYESSVQITNKTLGASPNYSHDSVVGIVIQHALDNHSVLL
jgi:hypothetical protein